MKIFNERLRELRTERKLTQKQCAEQLGVELSNYNKWENGISPNLEALCIIAQYFNVSADYLLGLSKVRKMNLVHNEYYKKIVIENMAFKRMIDYIKGIVNEE